MTLHKVYSLMLIFTHEPSLFSVIHDVDALPATLNNGLVKIQEWAYKLKMSFNPDRLLSAQESQEVIFSRNFN